VFDLYGLETVLGFEGLRVVGFADLCGLETV
jgi:hypothetical protein